LELSLELLVSKFVSRNLLFSAKQILELSLVLIVSKEIKNVRGPTIIILASLDTNGTDVVRKS
jgi:hypothetical protein